MACNRIIATPDMTIHFFYSIVSAAFCLLLLLACISAEKDVVDSVATIETPQTDGLHSHGNRRLRYNIDSIEKKQDTNEERARYVNSALTKAAPKVVPKAVNTAANQVKALEEMARINHFLDSYKTEDVVKALNTLINYHGSDKATLFKQLGAISFQARQVKDMVKVRKAVKLLKALEKKLY